jgi:hypothetical protein
MIVDKLIGMASQRDQQIGRTTEISFGVNTGRTNADRKLRSKEDIDGSRPDQNERIEAESIQIARDAISLCIEV